MFCISSITICNIIPFFIKCFKEFISGSYCYRSELPLTLNVNCCLVVISDELKSILDIAGSGISEIKLEFAESIICGLTILKSLVVK